MTTSYTKQEGLKENNSQKFTSFGFKTNGYLAEFDTENLRNIKVLDYAVLIIDSPTLPLNTLTHESFFFYKPGTKVELEKLKYLYGENCKFYMLFYPKEIMSSIRLKYRDYLGTEEPTIKSLSFKPSSYLYSFLDNIKEIILLNSDARDNMLHLKIQELLIYFIEKQGKNTLDFMSNKPEFDVVEFQELMRGKILKILTLDELAFISNMSVSKFKHTFEIAFNTTPMSWFREQRIIASCTLLTKSNKTIAEISDLIGYRNPSNFIKVFKKYYHITPNEYRNLNS